MSDAGEPGAIPEAGAGGMVLGQGGAADVAGAPDSGNAGESGSPDVSMSTDVTGLLLDSEGQSIAGAPIEIAGILVTTDTNGAFKVENVPAMYDAVVVSELHKEVDTYEGLTTRTPHFTLQSQHLPTFTAKLRGGLSGGAGFPSPAGHSAAVTAVASDRGAPVKAIVSGSGYTLAQLDWGSTNANLFTVGALQWSTGANSLPTGYDGWGTLQVRLSNGSDGGMTDGSIAPYNIALAALESHTVRGVLTVPSGCRPLVQVQVGAIQLVNNALAGNSFSYLLPVATPGAALQLNAICLYGGSGASAEVSVGLETEDTLAISVPASPTVSLPVADATGVTSATPFSWSPGDGGLTVVVFYENEPDNWSIFRFGTRSTSTFPDLVRFGIPFPKNLQVAWSVQNIDTGADATGTTDDALAPSTVFVGKGARISVGASEGQSFTTAP